MPAADDTIVAEQPPHEVLDVSPDASRGVIEAAVRAKKKATHPDRGGSKEAFQRVLEAEEVMLDE